MCSQVSCWGDDRPGKEKLTRAVVRVAYERGAKYVDPLGEARTRCARARADGRVVAFLHARQTTQTHYKSLGNRRFPYRDEFYEIHFAAGMEPFMSFQVHDAALPGSTMQRELTCDNVLGGPNGPEVEV